MVWLLLPYPPAGRVEDQNQEWVFDNNNIFSIRHNRKKLLRQYANNSGFISWGLCLSFYLFGKEVEEEEERKRVVANASL